MPFSETDFTGYNGDRYDVDSNKFFFSNKDL